MTGGQDCKGWEDAILVFTCKIDLTGKTLRKQSEKLTTKNQPRNLNFGLASRRSDESNAACRGMDGYFAWVGTDNLNFKVAFRDP